MPKKAKHEMPQEQSDRFCTEVQKLIDVGELNPAGAGAKFSRLLDNIAYWKPT